jgi:quercetin dioxygenase-like cupin family protein
MPVVRLHEAPHFSVEGFRFTGLTAPSRGASEISTWRLEIEPGAHSDPHWLDHEETFVLLDGVITVSVSGENIELHAGDALSVPARSLLELRSGDEQAAHAIVCLPAGAKATMANGQEVGTPPWAQ